MIVKEKVAKIQIWDTAGEERYRSITTAYYRGAAAILICCDCTNIESFNNVNNWVEEIGKYTDKDTVDKIILMNKCDLEKERKVERSEIEKFEKESGLKVLEVSAKTGEGIDKAFEYVISNLIDKNEKKDNNTMVLQGSGFLGKQGGCC